MRSDLLKQAIASVVVVGLSGCAVTPLASRLDEAGTAPGAWTATREAQAGIDTNWVDRFGDAQLERLVAEAYASNRDLKAAAARVERAAASARGAAAAARPQLEAALDGTRLKQNFIGLPIPGQTGPLTNLNNNFGASLNLSWELDLWGRVRAGEKAALADLEAEGFAYRAARASLAAQVVRSWLALAEANEQIELALEAVEVRRNTAELIRGRFEGTGVEATASDVRLAQTDIATAEANLAQRRGERDEAQRQLEILLGRYPSGAIDGAQLPRVPSMPPAGLPSELLLRRPDILRAERSLAAAGARVTQAQRAFYPSFALAASGGVQTEELREIVNSDFGVWSIAGQLAQPILNGGRLRSDLGVRGAEEREALATLQDTVLQAFGEVETALAAERFLADRQRAIEAALALATEGAEAAEENFALGTGDVLTLLTAQNRRIELAQQKFTLQRLRLANRVDLHLALGGDYRI